MSSSSTNSNPYYYNSNPSYDVGSLLSSMGFNSFDNPFLKPIISNNSSYTPISDSMLSQRVMHDWQTKNGYNPNYGSVAFDDGFNVYKDSNGKLYKDPNFDKSLQVAKNQALTNTGSGDTATNKGLLDQIMNALGIENAESFANGAKGLASLASIGQGIYNGIMQNRAFKLQKSAMEQAMRFNAENQARQRHEWARQDANRASISASWNGR